MRRVMTKMRSKLIVFCLVVSSAAAQPVYFPEPGDKWRQRTPAEVGMVGGTQQATPEQGGSGRTLICMLFILALVGVGGCEF